MLVLSHEAALNAFELKVSQEEFPLTEGSLIHKKDIFTGGPDEQLPVLL